MNKMSIRKDDLVVVLSGKDKGKQGKILEVLPKEGKVIVEKVKDTPAIYPRSFARIKKAPLK